MMLSGRTPAEKAERRAAKTQSLYVATPSSLSSSLGNSSSNSNSNGSYSSGTQSSFLPHSGTSGHSEQLSSPRKTRPYSMMSLQPHEDVARHQQEGYVPEHSQLNQHQYTLNESDEDAVGDGHSVSSNVMEYGEHDLKDVDSDTRMLISHLADLDCGLPILLERVKQNLHSCKDLMSFLKKKAVMEAEYGTNILKLASGLRESYRQQPEGGSGGGGGSNNNAHYKQGTYGDCWSHLLEMHERMGHNRLELSRDLQVVSEELLTIYKETDRSRKQFKEAGAKQERIVQEHEQNLEKAKQKYDSLAEEWERAILQKAVDPSGSKKTLTKSMKIFRQPKSVGQLHRQEEEARAKATAAHEQYKAQLARTNDTRQYYYTHTLPSILKNLKDTIDESDLSLQYYLMRYGYMSEDYVMKDAVILNPINGSNDLGLRDRVELINKDTDLQTFIQSSPAKANPMARTAVPYQEYVMSVQAQSIINPRPIFGCDLAEQLIRDEADLPEIVVKCTEAIERFGMDTMGIYRVSGIQSATNRLRSAFDRDCSSVDLSDEANVGDVNSVASVLKSWFRELPEPLLTQRLYPEFIKAARIEDPQLQLMNLHQVTNQLPDPNYATLKFLMCHLNRVQSNQAVNMMGASNLGLIFGPTLTCTSESNDAVRDLVDMGLQCKVVESLLTNYEAIFDIEDEEEVVNDVNQGLNHEHSHYEYGHGHGMMQPIDEEFAPHHAAHNYSGTDLQYEDNDKDFGDQQHHHDHHPDQEQQQQQQQPSDYIVPTGQQRPFEQDFEDRTVPVMEGESIPDTRT